MKEQDETWRFQEPCSWIWTPDLYILSIRRRAGGCDQCASENIPIAIDTVFSWKSDAEQHQDRYEELYEITKKSCEYLEKKLRLSDIRCRGSLHYTAFWCISDDQSDTEAQICVSDHLSQRNRTGNMLRRVASDNWNLNLPLSQFWGKSWFWCCDIHRRPSEGEKKLMSYIRFWQIRTGLPYCVTACIPNTGQSAEYRRLLRLATSYIHPPSWMNLEKDCRITIPVYRFVRSHRISVKNPYIMS